MKRLALSAAVLCLAPLLLAQSDQFEQPYAIEADGVLQGIAWKSRGGHKVVFDDKGSEKRQEISFNLSLFGNDPFYVNTLRNHYPRGYVASFLMTALRSVRGGGIQLPQVDTTTIGAKTGYKPIRVTFGGGSANSKESRGITVTGECVDLQPATTVVTREMVQTVKRQKLWTCSNFRISIGGVVIDDALSFEPIELEYAPFGDLDRDGFEDMALTGDSFAFEIPRFSKYGSTIFEAALAATRSGSPKLLPAKVEYLDEDGLTVLALSFVVTVNGIGPSDNFFDPTAGSNNIRVSTKIKRDLAVDMERRSGGF
jgi:hypothetical protein